MAKKTKDVKNYLSTIGKTEQLHVFIGSTDQEIENSSDDSIINLWQNVQFGKKISRGDVVGVIPNNTWVYGNVYVPWTSFSKNTGAFYVWNKQNGNVYLCLSNTPNNREEDSGKYASTYIPNHSFGVQKYPDGYTWLPIYRITSEYLRFVKNNWIPVISFEDFELYTFATEYQNISEFCGLTIIKTPGVCALYAKENLRLQDGPSTFINLTKGNLYGSYSMNCNECYDLFKDNTTFQPFFVDKNPPAKITIKSKLELVKDLIDQNKLSPSSAFYALYEIASNGLPDGSLVSVSVNLSSFSEDDLSVFVPNPELEVSSFTGTGARIRFTTYNTINGNNIINGIEIVESGSGYKDIQLDILESVFKNPAIKDILLSLVKVNFDIIDGLNVDPYDVLDCKNVQIDTRIELNDINQNNIVLGDTINFYTLVSNPLEETTSGNIIVSGSELSEFTNKMTIGYTTLVVQFEDDVVTKTQTPAVGLCDFKDTENKIVSRPRIFKVPTQITGLFPTSLQSIITVSNLDVSNISKSTKLTDVNNRAFIIKDVVQPKLKQYTGKTIQTVKTTKNLNISSSSGELSKVLRINIIKGI
jgi:hypothetical protein